MRSRQSYGHFLGLPPEGGQGLVNHRQGAIYSASTESPGRAGVEAQLGDHIIRPFCENHWQSFEKGLGENEAFVNGNAFLCSAQQREKSQSS